MSTLPLIKPDLSSIILKDTDGQIYEMKYKPTLYTPASTRKKAFIINCVSVVYTGGLKDNRRHGYGTMKFHYKQDSSYNMRYDSYDSKYCCDRYYNEYSGNFVNNLLQGKVNARFGSIYFESILNTFIIRKEYFLGDVIDHKIHGHGEYKSTIMGCDYETLMKDSSSKIIYNNDDDDDDDDDKPNSTKVVGNFNFSYDIDQMLSFSTKTYNS